jgi:hypothetical protein
MDGRFLAKTAHYFKGFAAAVIAATALVCAQPAYAADAYSYTQFKVPGSLSTEAFGINNRGEIVGAYTVPGRTLGFLRSIEGKFTTIDRQTGGYTDASGINDLGQVVGSSSGSTGYVLDDDGDVTPIYVPGSRATVVLGINNRTEIVGWYVDASNLQHGFLRHSDGTFTTIDVAGAADLILTDINAKGEIIGNYIDRSLNFQSFLRKANGALTVIAETGAVETHAYGLNDRGEIVGYTQAPYPTNARLGFLLNSDLTTFTTINDPVVGSTTRPNGINNRGEIVGGLFSNVGNQSQSGFFAVPRKGK